MFFCFILSRMCYVMRYNNFFGRYLIVCVPSRLIRVLKLWSYSHTQTHPYDPTTTHTIYTYEYL